MGHLLEDVVVADFTQLMQGAWASMKLGDMGAEVIKIEPPYGDPERDIAYAGEEFNGVTPGFLTKNRNKRSVVLNLKSEPGAAAAREIVECADVVMENFRPGVMDRLGFDYDDVTEYNEDVIYVSATGYGESGPYSDRPGQDLIYQAMSGLASITGRADDPPTPGGTVFVDEHSSTLIAAHTVAALYHRERTGDGQRLTASLLNSAIDFQCQEITFALNGETEVTRGEKTHGHPLLAPPYGIFETADGHLAIGWSPLSAVAETLDLPDLTSYETQAQMYENRDEIHERIESATVEYEAAELVEMLSDADVQAAPVRHVSDVDEDPQIQHNEMIIEVDHPEDGTFQTTGFPIEHSKTPNEIRYGPPALGEHTEEVLDEFGLSDDQIERVVESNNQ